MGGSGGVPLVEPWSAEQAWDPGRTTAMVPCSWLEMCWGFCMGWAGQPGWAWLLPSALFSVPLWAGHPPTLSLASTLVTWSSGLPAWHEDGHVPCARHTARLAVLVSFLGCPGRGRSGFRGAGCGIPHPHHVRGPCLRQIGTWGDFGHWRCPVYPQPFCGRRDRGQDGWEGLRGVSSAPGPRAPWSQAAQPPLPPHPPLLWTCTCMVILCLLVASQWFLSDSLPGTQGGEQQG